MNEDDQFFYFSMEATWLDAEKDRLLAIVSRPGRARRAAWLKLLEISDRTRQLNREFTQFMAATEKS
jgi:hypothetical protein